MPSPVTIPNILIGDSISFTCYGTSVIPNVVNGVVLGEESGAALRIPETAAVNHAAIYSSLPTSPVITPNNYTQYSYLYIQLTDGTKVEIGFPWIDTSSLTRLVRSTATISIPDVDTSREAELIALLAVNGFVNASVNFATS